jgi:poly [ADP-ribose] polymerase
LFRGRVGLTGQNSLQACGSLDSAKAAFDQKFNDKTKNRWANRANFVSYSGKYTLLQRDYSADDDDDAAMPDASPDAPAAATPKSKLDQRVHDLVKLICDLKMMKDAMLEVGYDANKLPLGKLSKKHIKKCYEVLQEISTVINGAVSFIQLLELSNRFASTCSFRPSFGMQPPPVINNHQLFREKIEMVESLGHIRIAVTLLRQSATGAESLLNPVDVHYEKLKCDFNPVEHASNEFQMIVDYARNTHGYTHNQYMLEVLEAFSLDREGETARFSNGGFDSTKNTQLLWHGSRLTNYVGIISDGLRGSRHWMDVRQRSQLWATSVTRVSVQLIPACC